MLVFSLKIERQRTGFSLCTHASYVVEARPVRSAVVVDKGLAEVITVAEVEFLKYPSFACRRT